jgi:hypothetical protein
MNEYSTMCRARLLSILFFFLLSACGGDTTPPVDGGAPPGDTTQLPDQTATDLSADPGQSEDSATEDTPSEDSGAEDIDPGSKSGGLTVQINHKIADAPLALSTVYTDDKGTDYEISQLRYWVSNVVLVAEDDSTVVLPDAYYLVEKTAAKDRTAITFSDIPVGNYKAVRFAIGVDEDHNHSTDVFVGELSTAVDMDWGWNSGFVFFKVEGNYRPAPEAGMTFFKMHVGFDTLYKEVQLDVTPFAIEADQVHNLELNAQVDQLFDGMDVRVNSSLIGGSVASPAGVAMSLYTAWFSE